MKKRGITFVAVATMSAMLFGCSAPTPTETLQKAFVNSSKMESYGFNATVNLGLEFPESFLNEPDGAIAASMFKDVELKIDGVYQKDPQQMEIVVDAAIKGDASISLSIPLVINEDTLWVKVPNIPFYPLPETVVGKYLKLDMTELNNEYGLGSTEEPDIEELSKFAVEALGIVFDELDTKDLISKVNKKDSAFPEGTDVDQYFTIQLNDKNLESFVSVAVSDIAPKLIDLAASPEWSKLLDVTKEDAQTFKEDLKNAEGEIEEGVSIIRESLLINDISYNMGLDKKDNITHVSLNIDGKIKDQGEDIGIKIKIVANTTDINKEPKFEIGIPSDDDIITEDQLVEEIAASMYSEW